MKSLKILSLIVFTLTNVTFLYAQEEEPTGPQTLNQQFEKLKDDSGNYQEYKVIKKTRLAGFWGVVNDTISGLHKEISDNKQTIQLQKKEIDQLKNSLADLEKKLSESEMLNDSIVFAGMELKKSHYNLLVWGIIIVLVLIIGLGFGSFRMNARGISQLRKDLADTDGEFNEYKRVTKEKEVKLRRELQTERNTVEELRNRLSNR